jgi:hypothetical protein
VLRKGSKQPEAEKNIYFYKTLTISSQIYFIGISMLTPFLFILHNKNNKFPLPEKSGQIKKGDRWYIPIYRKS